MIAGVLWMVAKLRHCCRPAWIADQEIQQWAIAYTIAHSGMA